MGQLRTANKKHNRAIVFANNIVQAAKTAPVAIAKAK